MVGAGEGNLLRTIQPASHTASRGARGCPDLGSEAGGGESVQPTLQVSTSPLRAGEEPSCLDHLQGGI